MTRAVHPLRLCMSMLAPHRRSSLQMSSEPASTAYIKGVFPHSSDSCADDGRKFSKRRTSKRFPYSHAADNALLVRGGGILPFAGLFRIE